LARIVNICTGRIQTVNRLFERFDGANRLQVVRERALQPHQLFFLLGDPLQDLALLLNFQKLRRDGRSRARQVFVPPLCSPLEQAIVLAIRAS